MNHTNHRANAGSFKSGQDQRRNTAGQQSKEAVALGALLKKYLIEEAGKSAEGWHAQHGTKAQALAWKIWDLALDGSYPCINYLAEKFIQPQAKSGEGKA